MKYIASAFLLLISINSFSYEGSPKIQVESFFSEMSRSTGSAIDNLYASNPAMKQKQQALTLMKSQLNSLPTFFGKYIGHEVLLKEQLSPSLFRISAVAKYEMHPVIWEFYFYKPKSKWIVSNAVFGDQFQNIGPKK